MIHPRHRSTSKREHDARHARINVSDETLSTMLLLCATTLGPVA